MRDKFLPFSAPSITEEDIAAVGDVMRSGWITTGPKNAEFETRFKEYTGAPGVVALASATAGMHVVLKALNIGPGDEVITPAMTWVSTTNLICLAGAKPVFADIERDTLLLNAQSVEPLITPRTKAIIPVHFAGAPCDLDAFRALSARHGIPLIEDAAHAVGTEYKGEKIGLKGTSIFSFHPIKNMTTGEGGMVCSDDKALLDRVRSLKFHGLGVDAYDRETKGRSPQAQVMEPGYKYNLTDMAAVLGVRQLANLPTFNVRRAVLVALYQELLRDVPELRSLSVPGYPHTHTWNLFIVRLTIPASRMDRDRFMLELKQRNIGTGLHFRAVHLQKYYAEALGGQRGQLPNTEWNSDNMCSLPLFPDMTEDDVRCVVATIKEVLASAV